jgi:hypothetical protein
VKVCTCRGYLTVEVISDAESVGESICRRYLTAEVISHAKVVGESMYMSRTSDTTNLIEYKVSYRQEIY